MNTDHQYSDGGGVQILKIPNKIEIIWILNSLKKMDNGDQNSNFFKK